MRREVLKYVWDVDQACNALRDFTAGRTFTEYEEDLFFRSAVERQLIIIGEALSQAYRLDPDIVERIRKLNDIIGFRNVIVHGYSKVENETVWGIIEKDVPVLAEEVRSILNE
jgi:uncharacterized protein with HEPN domain